MAQCSRASHRPRNTGRAGVDRQLVAQLVLVSAWLPSALPWPPRGLDTWQLSHSAQRSPLWGPRSFSGTRIVHPTTRPCPAPLGGCLVSLKIFLHTRNCYESSLHLDPRLKAPSVTLACFGVCSTLCGLVHRALQVPSLSWFLSQTSLYFSAPGWVIIITDIPVALTATSSFAHWSHQFICSLEQNSIL